MANTFEENLLEIDNIIAALESGDLELNEALKAYEDASKLLKSSSKLLEKAQGKLNKVTIEAGEVKVEEL